MPFRLRFAENGYVHVCGHRGNSLSAPENTLPALRAAAASGATVCEIDVVLAGGDAIVLLHDELLDRTTNGRGPVADLELLELKRLDQLQGIQRYGTRHATVVAQVPLAIAVEPVGPHQTRAGGQLRNASIRYVDRMQDAFARIWLNGRAAGVC